ncbi:hypothetical protein VTN77DRAFT_5880 [Rasamsonia byssochlamydoides]|uniref:uncharacterized protein n=1 Tax=Rasamsonia byssochlamydoides TaxID=89139 RepID=UPI00374293DF
MRLLRPRPPRRVFPFGRLMMNVAEDHQKEIQSGGGGDTSSGHQQTRSNNHHTTTTFSDKDEFAVRGLLALGTTSMNMSMTSSETETKTETETPMMMASHVAGFSPSVESPVSSTTINRNGSRGAYPLYHQQQQQQQHQHQYQRASKKSSIASMTATVNQTGDLRLSPATTIATATATATRSLNNDITLISNSSNTVPQQTQMRTLELLRHYRYDLAPWVSKYVHKSRTWLGSG